MVLFCKWEIENSSAAFKASSGRHFQTMERLVQIEGVISSVKSFIKKEGDLTLEDLNAISTEDEKIKAQVGGLIPMFGNGFDEKGFKEYYETQKKNKNYDFNFDGRAIVGDKSDNLPGVGGIGLPTIKKRFPFLSEDNGYNIETIVSYCANQESKVKAFSNILEKQNVIEENYQLMQLYAPSLSVQGKQKINFALENFEPEFAKTNIKAMMIEDGFGVINFVDLFAAMNKIVADSKL